MASNKREVLTKCAKCNFNFTAIVWNMNGKETTIPSLCPSCNKEKEEAERTQKLEKELSDISSEQEDAWLETSNIPPLFYFKTFSEYKAHLQPTAFKVVKTLKWKWDDEIPPHSLVLTSPGLYGVGKTHLVCALVKQIIATEEKARIWDNSCVSKKRCPVYFISENQLLRNIRDTYSHKDDETITEEKIYANLKKFSLLIIDDVGKVRARDSSFLQGVYFNIIDQRYNDSQPIILTTNLDYSELEEHIGGACADRLREMCGKSGFVKMTGKSYRRKDDLSDKSK